MATVKVKKPQGAPGFSYPKSSWPRIVKPMRSIRSIRTLMKRDESKGIQQPEFKNTLQRAGVGTRQAAKTVTRQRPNTPPAFSTRHGKTVPAPDPTSGGGVKKR